MNITFVNIEDGGQAGRTGGEWSVREQGAGAEL